MEMREKTKGGAAMQTALLEPETGPLGPDEAAEQPQAMDGFDPSRYLTKIDGRDYLEVKWRLLWLRTEFPTACVRTELMKHDDGFALFRAEVTLPSGAVATGWGSEMSHEFNDFIEAAETKAIGRALAALGFGTQFCRDFDFMTGTRSAQPRPQIVDSPVGQPEERHTPATPGRTLVAVAPRSQADNGRPNGTVTDKQLKAIYAIARAARHLSEQDVDSRCQDLYRCRPSELSKFEASQFIDTLKGEQAA